MCDVRQPTAVSTAATPRGGDDDERIVEDVKSCNAFTETWAHSIKLHSVYSCFLHPHFALQVITSHHISPSSQRWGSHIKRHSQTTAHPLLSTVCIVQVGVLVGLDGPEGLGVGRLAPHQHGVLGEVGEPVAQADASFVTPICGK